LLDITAHDILTQLVVKVLGVRNECEERTEVRSRSVAACIGYLKDGPYNNAVSSELVEMEEALNAEQVVDSVNGIQLCASVTELDEASRPRKKGFFIATVLLLLLDLPGRWTF
jgi:hypothetical protein